MLVAIWLTGCWFFLEECKTHGKKSVSLAQDAEKASISIDTGRVIVKVCVNVEGKVVSAVVDSVKSTTLNPKLTEEALQKSRTYTIKRESADVTRIECGDITFNFKFKMP